MIWIPSLVNKVVFYSFQMEIAKRLNAIIAQLLPFLSQEVNIYLSKNFIIRKKFQITASATSRHCGWKSQAGFNVRA